MKQSDPTSEGEDKKKQRVIVWINIGEYVLNPLLISKITVEYNAYDEESEDGMCEKMIIKYGWEELELKYKTKAKLLKDKETLEEKLAKARVIIV